MVINKKDAKVYFTMLTGKSFNSWKKPEKASITSVNKTNCLMIKDAMVTSLV